MTGMSRYFCHDHPDVLTLDTTILDARPGAVVLEQSPLHPGGGGRFWHLLADPVAPTGAVRVDVDPDFRAALRILKIDNKGRHNRRVKYGIVT